MNCSFCNAPAPEGKIHFRDTCPRCGRDLHVCMNCEFYDRNASRECREPAIQETVGDKERANFCEYFRSSEDRSGGAALSAAEEARKKLEALFKS